MSTESPICIVLRNSIRSFTYILRKQINVQWLTHIKSHQNAVALGSTLDFYKTGFGEHISVNLNIFTCMI